MVYLFFCPCIMTPFWFLVLIFQCKVQDISITPTPSQKLFPFTIKKKKEKKKKTRNKTKQSKTKTKNIKIHGSPSDILRMCPMNCRCLTVLIRRVCHLVDLCIFHTIKGGRIGRSDKVSLWCISFFIKTRFRFFF